MKRTPPRTAIRGEVLRFAVPGVVLLGLLAAISLWVAFRLAQEESVRRATDAAQILARTTIEPNLARDISSPRVQAKLDEAVRQRILTDPVVTVRLWSTDGTIVYADKQPLIGEQYPLDDDKLRALATGEADADVSDLSSPENRLERGQGDLAEVYLPVQGPDGTQYLFELYQRQSALQADTNRMLAVFIPVIGGSLLVLGVILLLLAWRMATRLAADQAAREALLEHAVDASDLERKRIAADLHDGAVQELAGVSFALVGLADRAAGSGDDAGAASLRRAGEQTRHAVLGLRSLLVDIYPPNLAQAGLPAALTDLVDRLPAGITGTLDVASGLVLSEEREQAVYRVAREALQNVAKHAGASSADVSLRVEDDHAVLRVTDDGVGFTEEAKPGHLGLQLLDDLAGGVDGEVEIGPGPNDHGTTLVFRLPNGDGA